MAAGESRSSRPRHVSRRSFLGIGGAGIAAVALGGSPFASGLSSRTARGGDLRFSADPFSLGVASGDPTPDGVVLWTRLAPDPLHGGGMPRRSVPVQWELAHDERFSKVERTGEATADPELAHSVHAEVDGLEPGREYWYRFRAGKEVSPAARTRTAPAPNARLRELRFAFVSCQHYEHGFYTAYKHLAQEDVDLILHLGDYIYEYAPRAYAADSGLARPYTTAEPTDLAGYRNRHAEHRSDEDLQTAHRHAPFMVTWDDHEVQDNYASDTQGNQDPAVVNRRRAGAYRAYYEHMPLRRISMPHGPEAQLYRRLQFGDLLALNMLDTRQYRADQVPQDSPRLDDPSRTVLGAAQERWLDGALSGSNARWTVLAQQIFFARRDGQPGPGEHLNVDSWDGYPAARERLTRRLVDSKVSNPVILSGDVHANWVNDVRTDYEKGDGRTVATEFVGTSISSGGDGADTHDDVPAVLEENPHIKFFNGQRGYVRCTVTPDEWKADYRVLPYVHKPGAPVRTRATFSVADGQPGVREHASRA